jgi:hypothetical protein
MKSSKRCLSLGLATALLMGAVATTFGTQMQATPVKPVSKTETTERTTSSAHTKRQRLAAGHRRQRYSTLSLKGSAKKAKRVPKAKSLSNESY